MQLNKWKLSHPKLPVAFVQEDTGGTSQRVVHLISANVWQYISGDILQGNGNDLHNADISVFKAGRENVLQLP